MNAIFDLIAGRGDAESSSSAAGGCSGFRIPFAGCSEGIVGNILATLIGVAFLAIVWRPLRKWWVARRAPAAFTPDDAAKIRAIVRTDWVEPRFQQALSAGALKVPIAPAAELVEIDRTDKPIGRRIGDLGELLDLTGGRILVAGGPGAGKTVYAMQLARILADRSDRDDRDPVPLVVSVSSFSPERHGDTSGWVVAQMERLYGIAPGVARAALRDGSVALVLDGLDELMPEAHRSTLLAGLNDMLVRQPRQQVVLTSRHADLPPDIKPRLRHAVLVEPLRAPTVSARLDELAQRDEGWNRIVPGIRANEAAMQALSVPLYLDLLSAGPAHDVAGIAQATSSDEAERAVAT